MTLVYGVIALQSIAFFAAAAMAVRGWLMQRDFEVALLTARREGEMRAHEKLHSELSYSIGVHKLLSQPGSRVSEKWQKAFLLLYPEQGHHHSPGKAAVIAGWQALGFSSEEVGNLWKWYKGYPEILVALMLALAAGLSEQEAWAVAHNV